MQSIEELPEIIASAFQIAQSGRPGPVLIDVPRNIQVSDVPEHVKPIVKPIVKPTALSELKLAEAKALLAQAKKTSALCGRRCWYGESNTSDQKIPTNHPNAICFNIERFRLN